MKELNGKPDWIVIMEVSKEKWAVREAKKLNIPIIFRTTIINHCVDVLVSAARILRDTEFASILK